MAGILGKRWPVPIVKPLYPFFLGGAIVYYGVWKAQVAMSNSEEYKNDPRNPKKSS